ncbi:MAG: hypothetical protein JKY31_10585 [Rhodobacteraceae bacterium]|nr:hypothetical protein [Paracoccaceae bacterium]
MQKIQVMGEPAGRHLISDCVNIHALNAGEVEELYHLYNKYYAATTFASFESDFSKKNKVILLRNENHGIEGFSTLEISSEKFGGQEIHVLFSGDTIIDEAYWGTQALSRKFLEVTGELYREHMELPFYWFLIVKGHRTYRYLETFFKDYYPCHIAGQGDELKPLVGELARRRFGKIYNDTTGTLNFPESHGHLRKAWADIPAKHQARQSVKFFLEKNPNYRQGDELVCLCKLSPENFKVAFARRIFETGT